MLASVRDTRGVRKQLRLFPLGFAVIEFLIVRKSLGRVYNMDHSSHVRVNQAHELKVPRSRKSYRVGRRACCIVIH
jgi:hypothetical protein